MNNGIPMDMEFNDITKKVVLKYQKNYLDEDMRLAHYFIHLS